MTSQSSYKLSQNSQNQVYYVNDALALLLLMIFGYCIIFQPPLKVGVLMD